MLTVTTILSPAPPPVPYLAPPPPASPVSQTCSSFTTHSRMRYPNNQQCGMFCTLHQHIHTVDTGSPTKQLRTGCRYRESIAFAAISLAVIWYWLTESLFVYFYHEPIIQHRDFDFLLPIMEEKIVPIHKVAIIPTFTWLKFQMFFIKTFDKL